MLLAINTTFSDALSAINYYECTVEITATEIRRYRHVNEQWSRRVDTRVCFPRIHCVARIIRRKRRNGAWSLALN